MTIAAIAALCIVLLIISFVAPTLSRHPQRGVNKIIGYPRFLVGQLPGPIGRWAAKPFDSTGSTPRPLAASTREAPRPPRCRLGNAYPCSRLCRRHRTEHMFVSR